MAHERLEDVRLEKVAMPVFDIVARVPSSDVATMLAPVSDTQVWHPTLSVAA